ncbi:ATP-binding domain-containing protein [Streptomyces sp. NPDC088736]|uniref:ATP-binding domain-containing protein n=1 Tax=Streptomyces sp. NPDC088736 TaxID=3365881 RepID=UPI00382C41AE
MVRPCETATYPSTDLDELVHAYALTVHRSQGSQYPYVITPVINAAGMMLLQRNLLYTAVTRARQGVMLIGQTEAVERAVANNRAQRRNTTLTHRITHGLPAGRGVGSYGRRRPRRGSTAPTSPPSTTRLSPATPTGS